MFLVINPIYLHSRHGFRLDFLPRVRATSCSIWTTISNFCLTVPFSPNPSPRQISLPYSRNHPWRRVSASPSVQKYLRRKPGYIPSRTTSNSFSFSLLRPSSRRPRNDSTISTAILRSRVPWASCSNSNPSGRVPDLWESSSRQSGTRVWAMWLFPRKHLPLRWRWCDRRGTNFLIRAWGRGR